jgi:hypothetical protein
MKINCFSLLIAGFALVAPLATNANWEYKSETTRSGIWYDDGGRFTFGFRGGLAIAHAGINNDLGSLVPEPYWIDGNGILVSENYCGGYVSCAGLGYTEVGQIDIAQLGARKDLNSFSWVGGISVGWRMPDSPHWRIEASWDHISEMEYNASPMFQGLLESTFGYELEAISSGVKSTISTDILTAMIYYDFFDNCREYKCMVPYIGFGMGYADTQTVLQLTDLYGDLSGQIAMQEFGEYNGATIDFYTSKTSTANIVGALAAGFSYGLDENMFLDVGIKLMYLPKIKWALNNDDDPTAASFKSKDIFNATGVIYGTITAGLRFEF